MVSFRLAGAPQPLPLIAALAHHLSATILTNNVRDFKVMDVAVEQLGGAEKPLK